MDDGVIRALVFDFDGLIFDSESHELAVVRELYAEHGEEMALETWAACVGRAASYFDPVAHLEARLGRPLDHEALHALRRERFQARIAGVGALPGVEDALREARLLGLSLAVASSGTRAWVHGQLERLDLVRHFDCIRTRDDVAHAKPEPDLYLAACACLGVEPGEAVAFEDSPNGLLAARRAGLRTVVVPNEVTAALDFDTHDVRLDSLLECSVKDLLDRLTAAP